MTAALVYEIGARFGRLVVLGPAGSDEDRKRQWLCRCDCGKEKAIRASYLRGGKVISCGCALRERAREGIKLAYAKCVTHGQTRIAGKRNYLWTTWKNMRDRCANPLATSYKWYGGRGISVCEEWNHSFVAFAAHVGERPSPSHSIDRINNDGNYEPGNVRWATKAQQNANSRPASR